MRLSSLLDWWGRSYHTSRKNVVEAALQKAGEQGRTKQELVVDTEFAQHQVRRALRTLQREARVEIVGDRYKARGPKAK
jgi:hypothetical protein